MLLRNAAHNALCFSRRCGRSLSGASDLPLTSELSARIAKSDAVVFSKTSCGFCHRAKAAFAQLGCSGGRVDVLELDRDARGSQIQATLTEMYGQRTVPYVFVGGRFIGGGTETVNALQDGSLQAMLDASAVTSAK